VHHLDHEFLVSLVGTQLLEVAVAELGHQDYVLGSLKAVQYLNEVVAPVSPLQLGELAQVLDLVVYHLLYALRVLLHQLLNAHQLYRHLVHLLPSRLHESVAPVHVRE
jgi:hypothetical protein